MKISTNIGGWAVEVMYFMAAFYSWRIALRRKPTEHRGIISRSILVIGAVMMSVIAIYFLGSGLGLYSLHSLPPKRY